MTLAQNGSGSKTNRKKKRNHYCYKKKFRGNQFTRELPSASAKKLKNNNDLKTPTDFSINFVILCFNLVFSTFSEYLKCNNCNGKIAFTQQKGRGVGWQLCLECSCGQKFIKSFPSISNNTFEINQRIVFATRVLGLGHNGLTSFLSLMDINSSFLHNLYYGAISRIHNAAKQCFDFVTKKAVNEETKLNEENGNTPTYLSISGDGTWMKRGFTSLIGVFTIVGKYSGKVLDLNVKSSFCLSCSQHKKKYNEFEFTMWYEEHKEECSANHTGSSGKMECDSDITIFQRSKELYNVFYHNYIGDGDSKTYTNIVDANPYGNEFIVNKLECVLHVGKHMYRRLVEVKKNLTIFEKEEKKSHGRCR
ncbi:hypothetical protein TKK_0000184 [Trichogramma kaykai]